MNINTRCNKKNILDENLKITLMYSNSYRDGYLEDDVKECLINNSGLHYPSDFNNITDKELSLLRREIGSENFNISNCSVNVTDISFTCIHKYNIPLKIYEPCSAGAVTKVIVYIHGGGFVGGDLMMCDNLCRGICGETDSIIISVGYSLAPEAKFPRALYECYDAVKFAYEISRRNNIGKICVMGDSAGANLANACSMYDGDIKNNYIGMQILLYPSINIGKICCECYNWCIDRYNCKDSDIQKEAIYDVAIFDDLMKKAYLNNDVDLYNPYVTPILRNDLSKMPQTVLITAEYDYLRLESEYYAKRLLSCGVKTDIYRFMGMNHAFVEKLGRYEMANECMYEIIRRLKEEDYNETFRN